MTPKRTLIRRSDDVRIAELQAKIAELQRKVSEQHRADQPVVREAQKLAKKLREFAQFAQQHEREDVANSTVAFLAGLDRMVNSEPEPRRRGRREAEQA